MCLFCAQQSVAQSISTLMGARQTGMANTSATHSDEWSLFNNIAGLASLKNKSVGFAYEAVPSLLGANRMAVAVTTNQRWGNIGFGVFRFGDDIYSEQLISAGFANQIGVTSLGIKVNYVQYRADGFGTSNTVTLDFGGITQLTPQINIGAYVNNLTQSALRNRDGDRLPTQLVLGVGVKPSEKIFITTELQKDIDYKPTWRTGLEYSIYKSVFVRTGFNFNPQAAFFGLGFHKKNLKVDYAIRFNQLAGTTHQASAIYLIPAKEKK